MAAAYDCTAELRMVGATFSGVRGDGREVGIPRGRSQRGQRQGQALLGRASEDEGDEVPLQLPLFACRPTPTTYRTAGVMGCLYMLDKLRIWGTSQHSDSSPRWNRRPQNPP